MKYNAAWTQPINMFSAQVPPPKVPDLWTTSWAGTLWEADFYPNKSLICNFCHQKTCESFRGAFPKLANYGCKFRCYQHTVVQQFGVFWIHTVVPTNIRKEHCKFLGLEKQLSNCDSNYGYAKKFLHFQETIVSKSLLIMVVKQKVMSLFGKHTPEPFHNSFKSMFTCNQIISLKSHCSSTSSLLAQSIWLSSIQMKFWSRVKGVVS